MQIVTVKTVISGGFGEEYNLQELQADMGGHPHHSSKYGHGGHLRDGHGSRQGREGIWMTGIHSLASLIFS